MPVKVSAKDLIEAGAHYGHQSRRWNPKMEPYLHTEKDGVHIFDLIQTKAALEEALQILTDAAKNGKEILLVGTKKQIKAKVREVALAANVHHVRERWLGGTITNFKQIRKSTRLLAEMKSKMAAGEYKQFTKKERLLIEREIARLERFFGGIATLESIPDLVFVIDIKREAGAIKEANIKGVETIALVDSNCDPDLVTYPIPMNDDATRALEYVLDLVKEAILEGRSRAKKPSSKKTETKESKKTKK